MINPSGLWITPGTWFPFEHSSDRSSADQILIEGFIYIPSRLIFSPLPAGGIIHLEFFKGFARSRLYRDALDPEASSRIRSL